MAQDSLPQRKAKIICTLGPSSNTPEKIKSLALAGMDVARLNFSHGTHDEHKKLIRIIRRISGEINKPISIIQDLQGPKIRIQSFKDGPITLKTGDIFTLTTRKIIGDKSVVSVSYPAFSRDVKPGDTVLLDDGLVQLKVKRVKEKDVICQVKYGGRLSNHKGLNLPGSTLSVRALTGKDKEDLLFGLKMDVDYIALSFVQKPQDITDLKKIIAKAGKDTPVIAKIEKPQAVEAIEAITDVADVVMVARGDLGVEVSAEEVPPIQKHIISLCNRKGVPVITATQMLDSMIHNPRPTRAEASDVANAILDGSDAVMLSGETASGKYPVTAVQIMQKIVSLIEKKSPSEKLVAREIDDYGKVDISSTVGFSACQAAELINAALIVCLTQTGSTARMIARFRPQQRLIAATHTEGSLRRLNLIWGILPHRIREFGGNLDDAIDEIINLITKKGMAKKGDKIIITAGLPFYSRRGTNMLRIEEI